MKRAGTDALKRVRLSWLVVGLVVLFFVSLGVGRYVVAPADVIKILLSKSFSVTPTWTPAMETVVLSVRLPRLLAALLIGSSLALAGACFQGLFKNPLVSPDILGVSSGAGFGAAVAIVLGLSALGIQASALVFGLLAVGMAYVVRTLYQSQNALILVLAGVIISGFFSSALSFLKYVADPYETLPAIVFWLMGSIASVDYPDLFMVAAPILVCSMILLLLRWRFNVLSLGDNQAQALGLDVVRIQRWIILCATVVTACSVCISGTIGWVGLVVPHIARLLVGANHTRLLPASCVCGAIALIVLDDFARCLTDAEIPLGILTGLIGAPFFAYLLFRQRVKA